MTKAEAREAICAVKIEGPTLLLVDANQINMDDFVNWAMPGVDEVVLIVAVDGPPSISSLNLEELKELVRKLEAA